MIEGRHAKSITDHQGLFIVGSEAKSSEGKGRLGSEATAGSSDVGDPLHPHNPDCRVAYRCHRLRNCARTHRGAVFVICHIAHPVQARLNVPVFPPEPQQLRGRGLRGR